MRRRRAQHGDRGVLPAAGGARRRRGRDAVALSPDPARPRGHEVCTVKVLFLGAEFMLPYWRPEIEEVVAVNLQEAPEPQIAPHADATFAYAMNTMGAENTAKLHVARDACRRLGVPT